MNSKLSYSAKLSDLKKESFHEFAEDLDEIELRLTSINGEDQSTMQKAHMQADKLDLDISTVHGTRIRRFGMPEGASDLMGKARNIEWGYTNDGERDVPLLRPDTIVYHPPYEDDVAIPREKQRRNMVNNVAALMDSYLPTSADIGLENISKPTSLIYTPEDVRRTNKVADDLGVYEHINYTCDIGHTSDPEEMIEAMAQDDKLVNVHIHDTISIDDPYVDDLKEKYPLNDDGELIEWNERPGLYTHLPPGEGETDFDPVLQKLSEVGYEGPITFELHSRFKDKRGWEIAREELGY